MKIKVFHLRLTKENLQTDQDNLNEFLESVFVKKTSTELIVGQPNYWSILVFYDDQKIEKHSNQYVEDYYSELTTEEKIIYDTLKQWRYDKAHELNVPSFIVCHNIELMEVAKIKPQTLDELIKIKGFGEQKIAKHGEDILAVLNSI